MDRIYTSGDISNTPPAYPESPQIGFPIFTGIPGQNTKPGPYHFYMMAEEVRNVLVAAEITPDGRVLNQLAAAITVLVYRSLLAG